MNDFGLFTVARCFPVYTLENLIGLFTFDSPQRNFLEKMLDDSKDKSKQIIFCCARGSCNKNLRSYYSLQNLKTCSLFFDEFELIDNDWYIKAKIKNYPIEKFLEETKYTSVIKFIFEIPKVDLHISNNLDFLIEENEKKEKKSYQELTKSYNSKYNSGINTSHKSRHIKSNKGE